MEQLARSSILPLCIMTNRLYTKERRGSSAPSMRSREYVSQSVFSQQVKSRIKLAMAKAKRRGAWFSLDRKEKSILYLSVRLQLKFESLDLLRCLASILKKLEETGETMYARFQRGVKLAWAFSEFAVSCGNKGAKAWRNDRAYVLFLGRLSSSPFSGAAAF